MKVSDLAADLEVPASTILDQCQRFGIDATWAGAELSGADVVVLRAELATEDPIDLTGTDDPAADSTPVAEVASTASAASAAGVEASAAQGGEATPSAAAVPPTAVGSMPELLDEITPDPEPEPEPASPNVRAGGFAMAGAEGMGTEPGATRPPRPKDAPVERRLERSVRRSIVALVAAVAFFVASNYTDLAAVVAVLWLFTAVALLVAFVDGFRGRRRVQTHPERLHGVVLGTLSVVLAIGGLVGLTTAVLTVTGDDPAADAPASIGDLQSVQVARWGFQRAERLKENGWNQPAREIGSCWTVNASSERDEQRVELDLPRRVSCETEHTMQVMDVFAVNRDADAAYPGTAKLLVLAQDECESISQRLTKKGIDFTMKAEYPTEVGWGEGDHDVACVVVTPVRADPLRT